MNIKYKFGDVVGKLTILGFGRTESGDIEWEAVCECGTRVFRTTTSLYAKKHQHCGCVVNPNKHRLYSTISNINSRCYNEKSDSFPYYGAKGITVCDRWRRGVDPNWAQNFIDDMGPTFVEGLSLNRKLGHTVYCKEYCEWVTPQIQTFDRFNFTGSSSKYKGVTRRGDSWSAHISIDRRLTYLGSFTNEVEAAKAYDDEFEKIPHFNGLRWNEHFVGYAD